MCNPVIILNDDFTLSIFMVSPDEKPHQGDSFPLKAVEKKGIKFFSQPGLCRLTYFEEVYRVTEVQSGKGDDFIPKNYQSGPLYEKYKDLEGILVSLQKMENSNVEFIHIPSTEVAGVIGLY